MLDPVHVYIRAALVDESLVISRESIELEHLGLHPLV